MEFKITYYFFRKFFKKAMINEITNVLIIISSEIKIGLMLKKN